MNLIRRTKTEVNFSDNNSREKTGIPKINAILLVAVVAGILTSCTGGARTDSPIVPVSFTDVRVTDDFWAPRIQRNYKTTIPIAIEKSRETGRIKNFKVAAGLEEGTFSSDYPFDDSDVFKIIEGASYSLQTFPDEELEARLDTLIYYIGAAQEEDGYLFTNRTILGDDGHEWIGNERWELVHELSHELYNLGHLFEAAVAHYNATGKRSLLDVAIKAADLVDRDFGPGKLTRVPGHQEIEIGLVKLYRVTGDRRYLDLSKFFLDQRGPGGEEYSQAHKKVVNQDEAVGHAVRAGYMYTAMTDVAAMTDAEDYKAALHKIWSNVVGKKLYITGGVGATGSGEAFGENYQLPNMSAYAETCAAIANVFWNHRMFLMDGQARYYDVLERSLYNGVISGVSLEGDTFFYPNPLESQGQHSRSEWFGVACCPSNTSRFTPSVPGYVYATQGDRLYVNLFMENEAEIRLESGAMNISQRTDYPWDGEIRLELDPDTSFSSEIYIRVPGWVQDRPVPSNLYRFADEQSGQPGFYLNGEQTDVEIRDGYAVFAREWTKGDLIRVTYPMEPRKVVAHQEVTADRNRVALQRGPIVYAFEWMDNGGHVLNMFIDEQAEITGTFEPDLLNGLYTLTGAAGSVEEQDGGDVAVHEKRFTAIPYYAWANRGNGEMAVWIPTSQEEAWVLPLPTLASTAKVTASSVTRGLSALNDRRDPEHSNDPESTRYHWWPREDQTEWVQYEWDSPQTVSSAKVYWFDDRPYGGVRIPAGWELLYREEGKWKPVTAEGSYPVSMDEYNEIRFDPVTTTAVRLQVQLPEDDSSGILEWIVE